MAGPVEPFPEKDLHSWRLLERFRQEVRPILARSAVEEDPRRTLLAEDYFCSFLFAMLNPALTSLRALSHASHCQRMRRVSSAPFSPASFSEAQHVFSPEVLKEVARRLCQKVRGQGGGDRRAHQALQALSAVDGTLLRAVPRMAWARAPGPSWAVRLHLHFAVLEEVPQEWTVTAGTVCERKVLGQTVQPGSMVVADRYYSESYALLNHWQRQGVHFVFRLRDDAVLDPEGPCRPLTEEDRQAGVQWDRLMRLGVRGTGPALRVVRVETQGRVFLLATTREDLPAALIGLIYRQRWQIELFFKWIKTILNCRHWLAESPAGATVQIYCVLIAALLLRLWTGRQPNLRAVESLRLYWSGWATAAELKLLLRRAYGLKKS